MRLLLMFFLVLMNGCASVGSKLEGQYYLNKGDFAKGRTEFAQRLADNPNDPTANYYMARFELGSDKPEAARPYILKAVSLEPDNAEYHFWEGVTWWSLKQPDKEKAAYEKTLELNPRHEQATLYLGHNMLDRGKNAAALELYNRVLEMNPDEQKALFNKAVALQRLKRIDEMTQVLHDYLQEYPKGALASQGTDMLNHAGDFTWRNYTLGLRSVAFPAVNFQTGTATATPAAKAALDGIGEMLANKPDLNVHVVAYVKGNKDLAHSRAQAVREYVCEKYSSVNRERMALSWFGEAEAVKLDGKSHVLPESITIFTKVK